MWFVPSRGRPRLAQRLFNSGIKSKGALVIDSDDADNYDSVRLPFGWQKLILPRLFLGPKLNIAFESFPDEPWYGCLNDDHLPVTHGWEQAIIDAAGAHSIAWPDDNYGKRISAHVIGGELARFLGWTMCPRLYHYYLDDVHERLAEVVGGTFLPQIMVSHEHVNAGRAPMDRTYAERPSLARDRQAYHEWLQEEWPALKDKLLTRVYVATPEAA